MKTLTQRFINFIENEWLFVLFTILLTILTFIFPNKVIYYPNFVDWKTIISLGTLMVITKGIQESGYFTYLNSKLISKIKTEKVLSLTLITVAMLLSTFLTNDITLFIIVPITLSLGNFIKNDIEKLIIFEAIAVNIGSALTPIGNPQNLYIFYKWGISFINFIKVVLPLWIGTGIILLIFTTINFPFKTLKIKKSIPEINRNNKLFIFSLLSLILFITSILANCEFKAAFLIFAGYFILFRKIFRNIDWIIILMFIVMFIDFHLLSEISFIKNITANIDMKDNKTVLLFSAGLSQIISNVPTAVFVSKFSTNYKAILFGVNIGGNGTIISSFANIIALRFLNSQKAWKEFHKYSIPVFIFSIIIGLLII